MLGYQYCAACTSRSRFTVEKLPNCERHVVVAPKKAEFRTGKRPKDVNRVCRQLASFCAKTEDIKCTLLVGSF